MEFRNPFFSWVTCMKEKQFPVGKKKGGKLLFEELLELPVLQG